LIEKEITRGENLFKEGRIKEAEELFLTILKTSPKCKEVLNNLGVIAYNNGALSDAENYFSKAIEADCNYKNAILNYASVLHEMNKLYEITPVIKNIISKFPEDKELNRILSLVEKNKKGKQKILFICFKGLESFLPDIMSSLEAEYEVDLSTSTNLNEIETTVKVSDIVWLEWANELAINLTNHPSLLKDKYVICRLHSYEALSGFVQHIKWEMISDLIFVADHIKDIVIQQVPDLTKRVKRITVIPNGINLDKYRFKERRPGYNLAFLGNINFKKGPMLLLHAFNELVKLDNHYHLYIGGTFQDLRYSLYFNQMTKEFGLEKNIHHDGWIKDVSSWLDDKEYIVCSSVLEGHPVGLMEAMACGIKPVIHNFVGARNLYPEKYLWNSIHDFTRCIMKGPYDSNEYLGFIENKFSLLTQVNLLINLFNTKS
jgi:glycosyltransferase involved in cell wall biosynthesis